jgi:transposase-like protein
MEKLTVKRYSAAFRQSVVREYEAGASLTEVRGSETSATMRMMTADGHRLNYPINR